MGRRRTGAVWVAVLGALATIGGLAQPSNWLSNGSFESGALTGWADTSGIQATQEDAHAGVWAARITSQSMSAVVATTPGSPGKLTAWVRIVSTSGNDQGWGGFRLEVVSQEWKTLAHSGWLLQRDRGTNWFKVALGFTATTSQTRLLVGYFGDSGRQMVTLVDDVRAFRKPATNTPPVVSAELTPTDWTGLPAQQAYALVADDPDGAVERVDWAFGDGVHSSAWTGTRRVAVPGEFQAVLRVADDDGGVVTRALPWRVTDAAFPSLEVLEPAAGDVVVNAARLTFRGASSGAVTVSHDRGAVVGAVGGADWTAEIPLAPGWNRLLIQARGADGRVAAVERRVRYVPEGALEVRDIRLSTNVVDRWTTIEVTCQITNSTATHPQFAYDPQPPPGLGWAEGIRVDGVFTPDGGRTVYRRPGFLNQRYQRALKGGEEWLYPTGAPEWTVRFAPPRPGRWEYRIEVEEARGTAQSAPGGFDVRPSSDAANRGPVRVAAADSRYFEWANGTTFLGNGHNIGFSDERFSFDAESTFDAMGVGNPEFFRWWIAGDLWGSAWQPWNSRTLGYHGTVPKTGLTLECAYADGLASVRLDAANPIVFQGWMSGHAGLVRGRTYGVRIRWRTEAVRGPAAAGSPFGVCVKLTGWPEPGQTGTLPVLVPHVNGDTPWHLGVGTFVANSDLLPNCSIILENTLGGAAYVDEVVLGEVLPDGQLGPQLLRSPAMNSHLRFDPRRAAGIEAILDAAVRHGMTFKLNLSEKQEELLNWLGPDGLPDPLGGHFNAGPGTPGRWLHRAYWRHLFARFGASRAVHSWELVNEEDPNNLTHFRLAAELARDAAADGNPHPASTSTWAGFAPGSWTDPAAAALDYADFHAYVRSTGELGPKEELANDSARFFHEYDLAARSQGYGKPVVWGEQGIDGTSGSDGQDPLLASDTAGVWLHKIVWARTGPGGVYPLYWYTDHIEGKGLHGVYGNWNRFMTGVPLHNGRYVDAEATAAHPDARVFGQKDLMAGRAHLWIDHRRHTWRAVVAGSNVPPLSTAVQVALHRPLTDVTVTWFATLTGLATSTEIVRSDDAGVVTLRVTDLRTDVAMRLQPTPPVVTAPRIEAFEWQPAGLWMIWAAEPGQRYRVESVGGVGEGPWESVMDDLAPAGVRGEVWLSPGLADRQLLRLATW